MFPDGSEHFKKCPLKTEIATILQLYHDSDHPGQNATLNNIRREYYWTGMCEQVRSYVSSMLILKQLLVRAVILDAI